MTKINLIVDGEKITAQAGQSVMQAALAAGIYIPHICAHDDLVPAGSCRLCVVKSRAGKSRLPPAPHRQKGYGCLADRPSQTDASSGGGLYWLRIRPSAHPVPNI